MQQPLCQRHFTLRPGPSRAAGAPGAAAAAARAPAGPGLQPGDLKRPLAAGAARALLARLAPRPARPRAPRAGAAGAVLNRTGTRGSGSGSRMLLLGRRPTRNGSRSVLKRCARPRGKQRTCGPPARRPRGASSPGWARQAELQCRAGVLQVAARGGPRPAAAAWPRVLVVHCACCCVSRFSKPSGPDPLVFPLRLALEAPPAASGHPRREPLSQSQGQARVRVILT
jgi:hypothetical protein